MNVSTSSTDGLNGRAKALAPSAMPQRIADVATAKEGLSLVCFSSEWDKMYAAFTLATAALAMGKEVDMFFTFWGAMLIREVKKGTPVKRSLIERMMAFMLPSGVGNARMSKMHFMGLGRKMIQREMKQKNIMPLAELVETARELGANFHCCETSALIFGWSREELMEDDKFTVCGAVTMLEISGRSASTMFI